MVSSLLSCLEILLYPKPDPTLSFYSCFNGWIFFKTIEHAYFLKHHFFFYNYRIHLFTIPLLKILWSLQDKSQTWQLGISAFWSLAFLLASSPIYTLATRGHLQFPELLMLFHVSMSLQIWSPFSMTHHSLPDCLSFFLFITSFCKMFSVSLQLSYPSVIPLEPSGHIFIDIYLIGLSLSLYMFLSPSLHLMP